jgi:hypothetical protein
MGPASGDETSEHGGTEGGREAVTTIGQPLPEPESGFVVI